MRNGFLSEHFSGVAVKRLSAVEAGQANSTQHEFNGITSMRNVFGTIRKIFPAHFAYLSEDDDEILTSEGSLTWYDSRESKSHRSPEYRLFYPTTDVSKQMSEGDLLVVGKKQDDSSLPQPEL